MVEEIKHYDKLGKLINVGDCVAAPYNNSLMISKVVKITPKMVKIKKFNTSSRSWHSGEYSKYPTDLVILDGADVTAYLLKL